MFENPKHYEQEWDYVCESIAQNRDGASAYRDEVKRAHSCIGGSTYWRIVYHYGIRDIVESLLR